MERIKINIITPKTIFGNEEFTVIVEITNLMKQPIHNLMVDELIFPGTKSTLKENPNYSDLESLITYKNTIAREMESQIAKAYERQRLKDMTALERFTYIYTELFYTILIPRNFLKFYTISEIPYLAKEACKIVDWEDVIRLEQEIINNESNNSFLKKMFLINKDKLKRCLECIAFQNKSRDIGKIELENSFKINPGETMAFPFKYKAPTLLKSKEFDVQFKISYIVECEAACHNQSTGEKVCINASPFSIPLGALLGAIAGYLIRTINQSELRFNSSFWYNLIGSIILAIVFALITAKNSSAKRIITVEDFWGGIVSGAIAGMFSENLIEKISAIFFG